MMLNLVASGHVKLNNLPFATIRSAPTITRSTRPVFINAAAEESAINVAGILSWTNSNAVSLEPCEFLHIYYEDSRFFCKLLQDTYMGIKPSYLVKWSCFGAECMLQSTFGVNWTDYTKSSSIPSSCKTASIAVCQNWNFSTLFQTLSEKFSSMTPN